MLQVRTDLLPFVTDIFARMIALNDTKTMSKNLEETKEIFLHCQHLYPVLFHKFRTGTRKVVGGIV